MRNRRVEGGCEFGRGEVWAEKSWRWMLGRAEGDVLETVMDALEEVGSDGESEKRA